MKNFADLNNVQKLSFLFINFQLIISLFSIFFNFLTIFIFRRKRLKNTSYSWYYCVMLTCQIMVLAFAMRYWPRFFLDLDLRRLSAYFCKTDEFLPHALTITSDWLLTVILADRFLAVVYNNQFQILKQKWFQSLVSAFVLVYCFLVMLYLPWNISFEPDNSHLSNKTEIVCHLPPRIERFKKYVYFSNLIPNVAITCLLYVSLFLFIFQSRKRITSQTNSRISKDMKFAMSTIVLAVIDMVFKIIFGIGFTLTKTLRLDVDQAQAMFAVGLNLITLNYGLTFFVNVLFNSIFRQEFKSLFNRSRSPNIIIL